MQETKHCNCYVNWIDHPNDYLKPKCSITANIQIGRNVKKIEQTSSMWVVQAIIWQKETYTYGPVFGAFFGMERDYGTPHWSPIWNYLLLLVKSSKMDSYVWMVFQYGADGYWVVVMWSEKLWRLPEGHQSLNLYTWQLYFTRLQSLSQVQYPLTGLLVIFFYIDQMLLPFSHHPLGGHLPLCL